MTTKTKLTQAEKSLLLSMPWDAGLELLAELKSVHVRTIKRHIKALTHAGYIETNGRTSRYGPTRYVLTDRGRRMKSRLRKRSKKTPREPLEEGLQMSLTVSLTESTIDPSDTSSKGHLEKAKTPVQPTEMDSSLSAAPLTLKEMYKEDTTSTTNEEEEKGSGGSATNDTAVIRSESVGATLPPVSRPRGTDEWRDRLDESDDDWEAIIGGKFPHPEFDVRTELLRFLTEMAAKGFSSAQQILDEVTDEKWHRERIIGFIGSLIDSGTRVELVCTDHGWDGSMVFHPQVHGLRCYRCNGDDAWWSVSTQHVSSFTDDEDLGQWCYAPEPHPITDHHGLCEYGHPSSDSNEREEDEDPWETHYLKEMSMREQGLAR